MIRDCGRCATAVIVTVPLTVPHLPRRRARRSRPPSTFSARVDSASQRRGGWSSRRCSRPSGRSPPRRSRPGSRAGCRRPTSRRSTATSTRSRSSDSSATSTSGTAPAATRSPRRASSSSSRASSAARFEAVPPGRLDRARELIERETRLPRPVLPLPDRRPAAASPPPQRSRHSMHIPDGFLSNEVAVACAVPAIAAVGYGLRRAEVDLDDRRVPAARRHRRVRLRGADAQLPGRRRDERPLPRSRARRGPARAMARLPRAGRGAVRPGVRVRGRRHHGARGERLQHGRDRRGASSAG